jgi:8-oxo-dGTP pyrophosphatase MutT (NUDIX family)
MDTNRLLDSLAGYMAFDGVEQRSLDRMREFLRTTPAPFSRSTLEGHITGSAVLINPERSVMLMIWHEKLGRWLQPGGHCEPNDDADVQATALRELLEETVLPASSLQLVSAVPFDVDVHPIPARAQEPDHFHYDVRFLFELAGEPDLESKSYRWVLVEEVAALPEESLSRLAKKLVSQKTPDP